MRHWGQQQAIAVSQLSNPAGVHVADNAGSNLPGIPPGSSTIVAQATGSVLAMPSKPSFLPEEDDYDADD